MITITAVICTKCNKNIKVCWVMPSCLCYLSIIVKGTLCPAFNEHCVLPSVLWAVSTLVAGLSSVSVAPRKACHHSGHF